MSFDILSAELHCDSKALDHENNSSALKHNRVQVSPAYWVEDICGEGSKDDASYERDVCFAHVAPLLEEC